MNVLRVLAGREIIYADRRNTLGGIDAACALWEAEQSEPARTQEQRANRQAHKPAPAPRRVTASYSTIRAAVLPLLTQPRRFKDLIAATDGEFGDTMIRKVLANAIIQGEVVRNDENHTYTLAA